MTEKQQQLDKLSDTVQNNLNT